MRTRSVLTAVLAAFLLSGCSSAPSPESAEGEAAKATVATSGSVAAGPSSPPEAKASTPVPSPSPTGQEWADEKINAWVANSGIKSVKGFLPPYNLINSWESTEPGHIRIFLDDSYKFNQDGMAQRYETATDVLRTMGLNMFESIGNESPELETVTLVTEDGSRTGSYSRARTGAVPSDLDAWTDEKYVQWLDAMNDTYESFCGTTIKKLADYRACLPTDPHAYVRSVAAPAEGELVVTLSSGKWQNNTYDTDSMPGVDFVSSNMIIKINRKAFATEAVDTLTVRVQGEEQSSVANKENWG